MTTMDKRQGRFEHGNGNSVLRLLAGVYGLSVIGLGTWATIRDASGGLASEMTTHWGVVHVEVRDGFIYCRSSQDTLVGCGIVKSEWLPGMPGNGRFAHSVFVNEASSADRGKNSMGGQQRVYLRSWGHFPPTVEVRFPVTSAIGKALERWVAHGESASVEAGNGRCGDDCLSHEKPSNVVYLGYARVRG